MRLVDLFVSSSKFAPASTSNLTASRWPSCAAAKSGLTPPLRERELTGEGEEGGGRRSKKSYTACENKSTTKAVCPLAFIGLLLPAPALLPLPVGQQRRQRAGVPVEGGHPDGRPPVLVRGAHPGAVAQQQVHHGRVAVHGGEVERGLLAVGAGVRVGAVEQQQVGDVVVACCC